MTKCLSQAADRRTILRAGGAGALVLALPACATYSGGFSLTEAIRRVLRKAANRVRSPRTDRGLS